MRALETASLLVNDLLPSDVRDARVLASATAEAITVPAGAKWARVSAAGGPLWFDENKTAVKPTGDIVNGSAPFALMSGEMRMIKVEGGATLSVVSDATVVLSIEWYS